MADYHKVLTRCESGEWISQVYEIPWCVASGATPSESIRNLDEALSWALSHSQNLRGDPPMPLTESEWGDVVGKRPEDFDSVVRKAPFTTGLLSILGYNEDPYSRN